MAEDFIEQVIEFDDILISIKLEILLRAILVAYEIHDVVTGSRTQPADLTGNDGKKWITDNAKATVVLSSAMTRSHLENL